MRTSHGTVSHPHRPGRAAGPRERRHRRDHPEAIPEVDQALGLRPEPVRRMALPRPRRARARTLRSAGPNPDFVLNQPRYQGASILLARKNFGCGSSREHAPWALQQYGFRAIIAPSFADIFFNNCFKNGLLPIVLTEQQVAQPVRRGRCVRRLQADDRPRAPGRAQARRQPSSRSRSSRSASTACSNGLDDIAPDAAPRGQDPPFEAERLLKQPWLAHRSSS